MSGVNPNISEIPRAGINLDLPGLDRTPPRKPLPLRVGTWRHLRKPLRRILKRAYRLSL